MPTWVLVLIAIVVLVLAWRFLARPWLDERVSPHLSHKRRQETDPIASATERLGF